MSLGTLVVSLAANTAAFSSDLGKAAHNADKSMKQISDSASRAGKAMALALTAAAASLAAIVKSSANTADEIGKMAQKVGLSTEALSGLKHAGSLANVSMDQLRTGLTQLSKHMVDTGQSGVSVESKLGDIADQFKGMEDGAKKTALAVQYFGKSGADMIPLLNKGSEGLAVAADEAKRFGLVISQEAAQAAEDFNDNLTKLGKVAEGLKLQLGLPLLRVINDLVEQMTEGTRIAGSFSSALATFASINPFRSVGGNLKALREELEELEKNRGLMAGLVGYEAAIKAADARAETIRKQIEFLKVMQRQEALGGGGAGNMDARDRMLVEQERLQKRLAAAAAMTAQEIAAAAKKEADAVKEAAKARQAWAETLAAAAITQAKFREEQERASEEQGNRELEIEQQKAEAFEELLARAAMFRARMAEEQEAASEQRYEREQAAEAAHQAKLLEMTARRVQAERNMQAQTLSLAGNFFQALAGKSRAAALVAIGISKALAIGQATAATAAAMMRALADLGPVAGAAAAAKIKALGAVQVGLIAATGLVEAANVGRGGADLGSPANPVSTQSTPEPTAQVVQQPAVPRVIIMTSTPIQRQVMEELTESWRELAADGYPMPFELAEHR